MMGLCGFQHQWVTFCEAPHCRACRPSLSPHSVPLAPLADPSALLTSSSSRCRLRAALPHQAPRPRPSPPCCRRPTPVRTKARAQAGSYSWTRGFRRSCGRPSCASRCTRPCAPPNTCCCTSGAPWRTSPRSALPLVPCIAAHGECGFCCGFSLRN